MPRSRYIIPTYTNDDSVGYVEWDDLGTAPIATVPDGLGFWLSHRLLASDFAEGIPAGATIVDYELQPEYDDRGIQAEVVDSTDAAGSFRSIAYATSIDTFVAVANHATGLLVGTNGGTTWSYSTALANAVAVAWSPSLGMFAATTSGSGTNKIQTSTDGLSWTTRTVPSGSWNSICWSPSLGMFVAVGNGTNRVVTSTNGTTWTARSASSVNWTKVIWTDGLNMFVAIASVAGTTCIMTSANGTSWSNRTAAVANGTVFVDIAWSSQLSRLVIFCGAEGGSGTDYYHQYSNNGTSWIKSNLSPTGAQYCGAWLYGSNQFFADGELVSDDGITWYTVEKPFGTGLGDNIYGMAWSDHLKTMVLLIGSPTSTVAMFAGFPSCVSHELYYDGVLEGSISQSGVWTAGHRTSTKAELTSAGLPELTTIADIEKLEVGIRANTGDATGAAALTDGPMFYVQYNVSLDVEISSPASDAVISDNEFTVSWSAELNGSPAAQASYRVRMYDEADDSLVYDSGVVVSGTSTHVVGSGTPEVPWNYPDNGLTLTVRVDFTDDGVTDVGSTGDPLTGTAYVTITTDDLVGPSSGVSASTLRLDETRTVVSVRAQLDDVDRVALSRDTGIENPGFGFSQGALAAGSSLISYLQELNPDGLWSLSEAVGDALDLSGNENDGTVIYTEGHRAVEPSLYDNGLPGMRFLYGITNSIGNPVWGHGTYTTGWTISGTYSSETFEDHPLADFGITTGIHEATTANFQRPQYTGIPVSDGDHFVAAIIMRRTVVASGKSNKGNLYINLRGAADATRGQCACDGGGSGIALPVSSDWKLVLLSGQASSSAGTVTTLQLLGHNSWSDGVGNEMDYAYAGVFVGPNVTFANNGTIEASTYAGKTPTWQMETFDPNNPDHMRWIAVGSMGTGYSWASTAHASASTRAQSLVQVASDAAFTNLWDGGGAVGFVVKPFSNGGPQSYGRIVTKSIGWSLFQDLFTATSSGVRLLIGLPAGQQRSWRTGNTALRYNVVNVGVVTYNSDSSANDPTFWIWNPVDGLRTFTVGNGLSEIALGEGSRNDDSVSSLLIGAANSTTNPFDGIIGPICVWKGTQPTENEIEQLVMRAMASTGTENDSGLSFGHHVISPTSYSYVAWLVPLASSQATSTRTVLNWGNISSDAVVTYLLDGSWYHGRYDGGIGTTVAVADTFSAGVPVVVYSAGDQDNVYVAADGGTIVSAANLASGADPSTDVEIGLDSISVTSYLGGIVLAVAFFDRPLEQDEWEYFASLGRVPSLGEHVGYDMTALVRGF